MGEWRGRRDGRGVYLAYVSTFVHTQCLSFAIDKRMDNTLADSEC